MTIRHDIGVASIHDADRAGARATGVFVEVEAVAAKAAA
jgi:hypothetical protein